MPIYNINNKVLTHLSAQPSSGGDSDGQTFKKKIKLTHLSAQPSSGGDPDGQTFKKKIN